MKVISKEQAEHAEYFDCNRKVFQRENKPYSVSGDFFQETKFQRTGRVTLN